MKRKQPSPESPAPPLAQVETAPPDDAARNELARDLAILIQRQLRRSAPVAPTGTIPARPSPSTPEKSKPKEG